MYTEYCQRFADWGLYNVLRREKVDGDSVGVSILTILIASKK